MITRLRPRFYFAILLVVLLAALSGCGDKNVVGTDGHHLPSYQPSSTPQNVLSNLSIAYSFRDTTGYDSLFDAAYTGASFDPNNMNPITFTKADEARHIAALRGTATISNVTLQFPPTLIRETDGADPPGWATVHIQNMLLEINDSPSTYSLPSNLTQEFKFEPTTPSAGSPTDTTWHIVRWTEVSY